MPAHKPAYMGHAHRENNVPMYCSGYRFVESGIRGRIEKFGLGCGGDVITSE